MRFEDMGLREEILRAIEEIGYEQPTPIQEKAIPRAMAGRDLMCSAQTGTGKTAAFALPILHALAGEKRAELRALILVPTRELAIQVGRNINEYSKNLDLVSATAFGGVPIEPQEMMLRHGVDVLVATPGRLIDHMWRGNIDYRNTKYLVLDEADRMLDMGFIKDVRSIVREIPTERQSMLFSATLEAEIGRLAKDILVEPERIEVAPPASTLEEVRQYLVKVERGRKRSTLEGLIRRHGMRRAIIFVRTKVGASKLSGHLRARGIRASAIHSDRSQSERVRTLESFREGKVEILVATDIAARGLDINEVSHVVNYDVPYAAHDYVHRIGRTARAGREGMALTLVAPEDRRSVGAIERLIDLQIPWLDETERPKREKPPKAAEPAASPKPARKRRRRRRTNGSRRREEARAEEPARPRRRNSNRSATPDDRKAEGFLGSLIGRLRGRSAAGKDRPGPVKVFGLDR
ncbi:MAG: DEAD/DEAH box helicase [Candidatus Eisenbacteria bacterium]|nr:DEAD/DEAH box helicase [Candidatus Latescibacterota bacterium]MBD3301004.1 DEAD/DEAH box helicase [Candidatus Eisenbacteria bacterium]